MHHDRNEIQSRLNEQLYPVHPNNMLISFISTTLLCTPSFTHNHPTSSISVNLTPQRPLAYPRACRQFAGLPFQSQSMHVSNPVAGGNFALYRFCNCNPTEDFTYSHMHTEFDASHSFTRRVAWCSCSGVEIYSVILIGLVLALMQMVV